MPSSPAPARQVNLRPPKPPPPGALAPAADGVVYVDYDPIVLAHARALLVSHEAGATDYIDADLGDTGSIPTQASHLLDFGKPVAVTLIAILHAIPESDDPHGIVGRLMAPLPPGVVRVEDWRPEPGANADQSVL